MLRLVASVCFAVLIAACGQTPAPVQSFPADAPPHDLGDWSLFNVDGAHLTLNEGVTPYDLNTPLFTDYALKLRTVWLPPGTSAKYVDDRELDFPVGTIISKTFYYEKADDFEPAMINVVKADRENSLDEQGRLDLDRYVLIETRLLVRYEGGWDAYPYVWNESQTNASLEVAGDIRQIEFAGEEQFVYVVPDANQCSGCHTPNHSAKELRPLGPRAWQLNRPYRYNGTSANQLDHWSDMGILSAYAGGAPSGARWSEPGSASLEERSRAYLDSNCAHCHNAAGAADTSGLHLNIDAPLDQYFGICKSPVAVGRGSGDRPYDIYPGQPDDSILIYRMQHTDPAIAMPELGRSTVHTEGVALLSDWIASLPGSC